MGLLRNGERTRQKRFNIHTHTVKTSEEGRKADFKKQIGGKKKKFSFFNERREGREETKEKETDILKTNIKMIYESKQQLKNKNTATILTLK